MAGRRPDALLTCRYWAFGPKCPNHTTHGDNVCPYAHWDTGKLASSTMQRGTCCKWRQQKCPRKGEDCWYEHRETGTDGLYQGRLSLVGMDLEIANACAQAGFNTWNHIALLDLIWAVKRVVRRPTAGQGSGLQRPPKDPIYPDRYRPSGVGDNSTRKRKALHPSDVVANGVDVQRSIEMRGSDETVVDDRHPYLEVQQGKPSHVAKGGSAASTGLGGSNRYDVNGKTQRRNNKKKTKTFSFRPTQLDLEAGHAGDDPLNKRQKRDSHDCPGSAPSPAVNDELSAIEYVGHSALTYKTGIVRAKDDQYRVPNTTIRGIQDDRGLEFELRSVHHALKVVGEEIDTCFTTLKRAWDDHPVLSEDSVMPTLYVLRDKLMEVMNGSAQARAHVTKIEKFAKLNTQLRSDLLELLS